MINYIYVFLVNRNVHKLLFGNISTFYETLGW